MNKNLLSSTPKSPMAKVGRLMELEAQKKVIAKEIEILKADLLKVTQDLDVYTLKTGSYTISRVKRLTPKVESFAKLKEYLDAKDIPYMTEETFRETMKPTFKVMAEKAIEEKLLIPGMDIAETEFIMIRLADKER